MVSSLSRSLRLVPVITEGDSDNDRGTRARQALIGAAVQVFSESSLGTASIREIARLAGTNVAAISYHFGGKQGLYLAVMHHVVNVIAERIGPTLDVANAFLDASRHRPADCFEQLSRLLEVTVSNSKYEEIVTLSGIIVREQTQASEVFDVLYDGVLGRLHRTGERLMAAYITGTPDTPGFSIHYHALLSQALGFRLARATVMRTAGWQAIGEAEAGEIRAVVLEHARLVLKGLRAQYRRLHASPRRAS